jgi:hypothetical protein
MEVIDYGDYYFRRGKLHTKSGISGWYYSMLQTRFARRFARQTKKAILYTMDGLGKEARETKDMATLFFRMLESKLDLDKRKTPPTKEEVKEAIEQLKDVGRISVFASVSILPGGGFSLVGLELLARKFGIKKFTLVPSAFRSKNREPIKMRSRGRLKLLPSNMIEEPTKGSRKSNE